MNFALFNVWLVLTKEDLDIGLLNWQIKYLVIFRKKVKDNIWSVARMCPVL